MRYPLVASLFVAIAGTTLAQPSPPAESRTKPRHDRVPRVSITDNRKPAGVLHGNELVLHLVAEVGMWYPDGDSAAGAPVQAFAEENHVPRIPGPMIRARAGTEATVTLRNTIPNTTLVVHGLTSRTRTGLAVDDSVQLAPGETRTVHLRLDAPGTYYYWGTTTGSTIGERTREDAQLTGAIVVDQADAPRPRSHHGVRHLGRHGGTRRSWSARILSAVNGRSWPHTERLDLHGGRHGALAGDQRARRTCIRCTCTASTTCWTAVATADRHHVRAGRAPAREHRRPARPARRCTLTWVPERPGNWLFHCHIPQHFAPAARSACRRPRWTATCTHVMNHALEGMNGLVMGVIVKPRAGEREVAERGTSRRQLRLLVRPSAGGSAEQPYFSFAHGARRRGAAEGFRAARGPPIVRAARRAGEHHRRERARRADRRALARHRAGELLRRRGRLQRQRRAHLPRHRAAAIRSWRASRRRAPAPSSITRTSMKVATARRARGANHRARAGRALRSAHGSHSRREQHQAAERHVGRHPTNDPTQRKSGFRAAPAPRGSPLTRAPDQHDDERSRAALRSHAGGHAAALASARKGRRRSPGRAADGA